MILAGTQVGISGSGPQQQCTVTITPNTGNTPITVGVTATPVTAHIFYTKGGVATDPGHTGDSALPGTNRIGSNSGSIATGAGTKVIRALAYAPAFLDSTIEEGDYEPPGGA